MTRRLVRTVLPLTVLILGFAGLAPEAHADVRLASPTSVDTTGNCLITACRLDRALAVAQANDEVALEDGVPYTVNYEAKATNPVTIRPATSTGQPRLVGATNLVYPTLTLAGGGTVRRLQIESSSAQGALKLARGARGYALQVFAGATSGEIAVWLVSDPAGTALVNSVATTASAASAVEAVDPSNGDPAGGVSIVNVTAIATGGNSWGVTTGLAVANPVLRNSIVRSTAKALHGRSGTMAIQVSNTNFPSSGAANFVEVGGNQKDIAVTFADAGLNNYRVPAGQPTIDAGAADALTTASVDPDRRARILGAAQDLGAYEYDPAPPAGGGATTDPGATTAATPTATTITTTPTADEQTTTITLPDGTTYEVRADGTPILPDAVKPILGQTVTVGTAGGKPLIRMPGTKRFVPLAADASIPVGSAVDVTKSRIKLTSIRDAQGRTQTGEFWGGRFVVRQAKAKAKAKTPYTDLVLTGRSFAGCPKGKPKARRASVTAFAAKASKKKTVVRSLWGRDDKGHFRTRGRNSVATVRGTVWLVQDRCDGTLTRVTKGAVDVREKSGRLVRLRAGRSHLARSR